MDIQNAIYAQHRKKSRSRKIIPVLEFFIPQIDSSERNRCSRQIIPVSIGISYHNRF